MLIKNIEKGNNYMAANIYTYAALSYIDDDRQYGAQALSCLVKAESISTANKGKTNDAMRDFRENFLWYTYAFYHLKAKKGSIDKAHYYMSLLEEDATEDSRRLLFALRMEDNMKAGRWKEALAASDSLVKIKQQMDIMPYNEGYYHDMATIYKGLHGDSVAGEIIAQAQGCQCHHHRCIPKNRTCLGGEIIFHQEHKA